MSAGTAGATAPFLYSRCLAVNSTSNDRPFPATNFQFVAVRVLEEECVIARAVIDTHFGPFERFAACFAHQLRNPINFVTRIRPKRDARPVGLMVLILGETKKFRRLVATGRIKRMEISTRHFSRRRLMPFANKPKLRKKFSVELYRHLHVSNPQIDVIKKTRLHFVILNWFPPQFNRL